MGTITNANRLVTVTDIKPGDIIPGIDSTRHFVLDVKDGRNLILGYITRIETVEILPSGATSAFTQNTDVRKSERLWVEN